MAKYKCLVDSYSSFTEDCIYDESDVAFDGNTVKSYVELYPNHWKLEPFTKFPRKMLVWNGSDISLGVERFVYAIVDGIERKYITKSGSFIHGEDITKITLPMVNGYTGYYDTDSKKINYEGSEFSIMLLINFHDLIDRHKNEPLQFITIDSMKFDIDDIINIWRIISDYSDDNTEN